MNKKLVKKHAPLSTTKKVGKKQKGKLTLDETFNAIDLAFSDPSLVILGHIKRLESMSREEMDTFINEAISEVEDGMKERPGIKVDDVLDELRKRKKAIQKKLRDETFTKS